jgi:basic membrane lipoprotein Med (substrate-binding protein (PBP1-ABC) superfamily)
MKKFFSIAGTFVLGAVAYAYLINSAQTVIQAADKQSGVQYHVFWIGKLSAQSDEIAKELNKLAEDGWRVKAGAGYSIILEK